jgi:mitochondrial fission protein ELM1
MARLATAQGSPIVKFIDIASAGPGSLGELLSTAEAVFCSVDSSSMVSETVWARRPVIVVAPQRCIVPEPELEYRRYLAANNWARTIAIADLAPESVATMLAGIKPLAANPLDQLAALLEKHQPALFAD